VLGSTAVAAASAAGAVALLAKGSLIGADDRWAIWAVIAATAAVGIRLERTQIGRALSGAVCAMLTTSVLALAGVLPAAPSPHVASLQALVVALATPLLLLGADLRVIFDKARGMLPAFALGATGTCLGATLAFVLLGPTLAAPGCLGADGWRVGAALTAKNIGGGLNFVGAAQALGVSGGAVTAALTVDNVLGLVYFPLVNFLGRAEPAESAADPPPAAAAIADAGAAEVGGASAAAAAESLSAAVAVAVVLAAAAEWAGAASGAPPTILSAAMAVGLSTAAPAAIAPLAPWGALLGKQLLFLFFASVGVAAGAAATSLAPAAAVPLGAPPPRHARSPTCSLPA
jgi:hypothetical protein